MINTHKSDNSPACFYMSFTRYLLLGVAVLSLSACAFKQPDSVTSEEALIQQQQKDMSELSQETGKAAQNLFNKARLAAQQGELGVAEANLERAIRIEPRNAVLWHHMAKLRLHQGKLQQASGLAAKSNSLDRSRTPLLQAENWRIIAHARHRGGNLPGAKKAEEKADAYMEMYRKSKD